MASMNDDHQHQLKANRFHNILLSIVSGLFLLQLLLCSEIYIGAILIFFNVILLIVFRRFNGFVPIDIIKFPLTFWHEISRPIFYAALFLLPSFHPASPFCYSLMKLCLFDKIRSQSISATHRHSHRQAGRQGDTATAEEPQREKPKKIRENRPNCQ